VAGFVSRSIVKASPAKDRMLIRWPLSSWAADTAQTCGADAATSKFFVSSFALTLCAKVVLEQATARATLDPKLCQNMDRAIVLSI
jgi:hypothetical protein